MFNTIFENLMVLLPLLVIELGLLIFSLVKISKEGVGNLTKPAWIIIVVVFAVFGPFLFLIAGRKRDAYDTGE